jgi:hypothetical protein
MSGTRWREVPVGLDAHRWVTRAGCKTVLVAVHTVTSGQRLLDVARLVESDLRIQVIFTVAPDVFNDGVADFLDRLGGMTLPWDQVTRLRFDLAVAAAYGSVHELHAPLIVVPHGAGYNKLVTRQVTGGAIAARGVYGLDAQRLVRDGRVIPTSIALSHGADLARLGHQCPEALPAAVVVGDPCYDRLKASRAERLAYRETLGVDDGQRLVVAASTWGPHSLFGRLTSLLDRMIAELPPDEYRIAALIHPNVWFGHGPRQVRAWLADCVRHGMALIPPTSDWCAALAAADLIVGDHGSVAVYGTALDTPIVLAGFPDDEVDVMSAAAMLASTAPRLKTDSSLLRQLDRAIATHQAGRYREVAERITSEPGRFNRNMRRLMYRLLGLSTPAVIPAMPPAALPFLAR